MTKDKYNLSPNELINAAYRVPLDDWTMKVNGPHESFESEIDGIQIHLGRLRRPRRKYVITASSNTVTDREGNLIKVGQFEETSAILLKSKESEHLKRTRELYHTLLNKSNDESMGTKEQAVATARDGLAGLVD